MQSRVEPSGATISKTIQAADIAWSFAYTDARRSGLSIVEALKAADVAARSAIAEATRAATGDRR